MSPTAGGRPRVAVVAASYGDAWHEEQLIARRVAGALACAAEVEVLVAQGDEESEDADGAVAIRRFPSPAVAPGRREAIDHLLLRHDGDLRFCSCIRRLGVEAARDLPGVLRREAVRAEGGDSEALYAYLGKGGFDGVVFAGYRSASTCFGMDAVPAGVRVALLPGAVDDAALGWDVYDGIFERAERILVCTETERRLVEGRLGGDGARVRNVRFALKVSPLAGQTEPHGFEGKRYVVVLRDWRRPGALDRVLSWAARLANDFEDVAVVLGGRGWRALPDTHWVRTVRSASRVDLWRWASRALAVLDPDPNRLLGREVLESLLYGTPVLVRDDGGASREHAEAGNGGLWFEGYGQLAAGVEALFDEGTREALGRQGAEYAAARYSDPEAFVREVTEAVLG